jgi:hypothetical protein
VEEAAPFYSLNIGSTEKELQNMARRTKSKRKPLSAAQKKRYAKARKARLKVESTPGVKLPPGSYDFKMTSAAFKPGDKVDFHGTTMQAVEHRTPKQRVAEAEARADMLQSELHKAQAWQRDSVSRATYETVLEQQTLTRNEVDRLREMLSNLTHGGIHIPNIDRVI